MDISYYKQYEPLWGSWHITHEIGEGGCGKVFEIERKDEFSKSVYKSALKVITVPANATELESAQLDGLDEQSLNSYFYSMVQKFVHEFELMFQLKGETNIVNYEDHSVIEHKDGVGWDILIKMELLTPTNDYFRINENLSCYNIVRLGIDMCKALEVCQSHKIIHRDIKPGNIFVNEKGDFKLGDFGVSRIKEETESGLTKVGTTAYMAPEVYLGQKYNSSVDIYSLGLVLYRLLNYNRLPFLPSMPEAITYDDTETATDMRFKGEQFPSPANGDETLKKIVLKACAYNEKDRFHSPKEMREELEKLLPIASKESIAWVGSKNITTEPNTEEIPITDKITQTTEHPPEPKKRGVKEWLSKQKFLIDSTKGKNIWIGLAVIAVIVIIVDVALLYNRINKKENISENVNVSESQIYYSDFAAVYEQYRSDISAAARAYIETKTDKSILGIYCDDFDFNGTEEAFAITGTISSESVAEYENCTVYYANDVSCIEISEKNLSLTEYEGAVGRIVENEDNCFFTFETSGYYSPTVYTVYNNEVKEIPVLTDYNCHGLFCKNNTFYTYDQSDNKDVMLKVKRTQFGCAQGLVPYLVSPNDIEMTRIFAENESVWLNSDVSSFTFIDLDGEAPLELATLNSSEDNDYSSYIAFYKVDAKNKTVEQILCNDYIECGYLSGFTFMNLYRNIYSGELIYSVNNNYLKLINGKIYNFSEDIVNEGDALLYSSYFAVTYGEYAYDKDFLALSYARLKYEGYSEDTSSNYGSMQDAYKAVLNNYNQNSEYISELDGYFMFDIDDNDIHELIVVRNYQMIECCYDFYTYSDGRPIFVGTIFDSHSSLYVVESGKQLNLQSVYMGYENIMLIGLSKYRIDTLMIFEKEYEPDSFDDYSKVDGIYVDLFAFDDLSLIENPEIVAENYYETLEENKTANQSEEKTTYKNWLSGLFE